MHDKHIRAAASPLLALILMVVAPQLIAAPSGPDAILEASGNGLAYLEVNLSSRSGEGPVRYQLKGSEGLIVGSVTLPAEGSNYEITAFDKESRVTYFGRGSIPSLKAGDPPVQIALPAANPEEGRNDGLLILLSRERLVLEVKPMDEPNSFSIEARASDPRGNAVPLDPNDVHWGITDPTHFELQSLKERVAAVIRPRDESPHVPPASLLCHVPTRVQLCIPNRLCRAVPVCNDPWVAISAGHSHTCALTRSGVAYCWGSNGIAELGAPNTGTCITGVTARCSTRPLRVECAAGEPCLFTQIAAGREFTVATDINGNTWSWGRGANGHQRVSAANGTQPLRFVQITAGDGYGCGLVNSREVWCWGENNFGQTGAPLTRTHVAFDSAVLVYSLSDYSKVVAGGQHTCASVTHYNEVVCWGRDDLHQTMGPHAITHMIGGAQYFINRFLDAHSILDVAVSADSSCATLDNGRGIHCWGSNSSLDLKPLGTPDRLAAGAGHVCTISAQTVSCVGANNSGQLGIGSLMDPGAPVSPNAPPVEFASISTGTAHTCGLTPSGEAYCWGRALDGQVGNGVSNWSVMAPAKITVP